MSIQRIVLNINGVDREILCEPEKDSLADVVRRLGLTGTKVGCGTGHCGACSLLLDGEVTRSCVKKMKQVKAYAKVETIEGLGSELSWDMTAAMSAASARRNGFIRCSGRS